MAPKTVVFEEANTSADCVKRTTLGEAGSPDIDVTLWEWTTNLSGCPQNPSLNLLVDGVVTKFGHPSASTLGLVIAPLKKPHYEGTVGLYKRRGNGNDGVLALKPAHAARPPSMHTSDLGLPHKAAGKHREEIIAEGDKAFENSITVIKPRTTGTLQEIIESENRKMERL